MDQWFLKLVEMRWINDAQSMSLDHQHSDHLGFLKEKTLRPHPIPTKSETGRMATSHQAVFQRTFLMMLMTLILRTAKLRYAVGKNRPLNHSDLPEQDSISHNSKI